jgi:hypothetical protein
MPNIGFELFKLDLNQLNINKIDKEIGIRYYIDNQLKRLFLKELESNSEIQIYNLLGMEVIKNKTVHSEYEMDLQSLQSGVYVITVKSENSTFSKKIIIE